MNDIKIVGIGAITNLGTDIDTIWENVDELTKRIECEQIDFISSLNRVQKRRMDRYSQMAVYTAQNACKDCGLEVTTENEYDIGTIYTTGFGPLNSNLKFARTMKQGDPDLCSPMIFSATVSNSCVGNICINLGCKGVSTLIMGSNNLDYSSMLLNKGDAKYILTGSVEEYCEDLYVYLRGQGKFVNECAITLVVTNSETEDYYAKYMGGVECNIGVYPLTDKIKDIEKIENRMYKIINNLLESQNSDIDVVFFSGGDDEYDSLEKKIIKELLPEDTIQVCSIKDLFGDTFGTSYNLNVMVAALSISKGRLPKAFVQGKKIGCALVMGFDVSGNFMACILER